MRACDLDGPAALAAFFADIGYVEFPIRERGGQILLHGQPFAPADRLGNWAAELEVVREKLRSGGRVFGFDVLEQLACHFDCGHQGVAPLGVSWFVELHAMRGCYMNLLTIHLVSDVSDLLYHVRDRHAARESAPVFRSGAVHTPARQCLRRRLLSIIEGPPCPQDGGRVMRSNTIASTLVLLALLSGACGPATPISQVETT